MNFASEKKNWREFHTERKRKKSEKIIKRLDKIKAKQAERLLKKENTVVQNVVPKRKSHTCSIAVPGSILENAQTLELRTYVAGQIARAAAIYKVNEIIIFDDTCENQGKPPDDMFTTNKNCVQFARILQYLECPQYLRKYFFPIHKDLKYIGIVNPLDAPHHLRESEESEFREGVTTEKPKRSGGCYVDVGLSTVVGLKEEIPPGLRVTVRLEPKSELSKKRRGAVVSADTPMREKNLYWGYSVRIANSLEEIFLNGPFPDGYDLTIGTSDKGRKIDDVFKIEINQFEHILVVFGGLQGLETVLSLDAMDIKDPSVLFDLYLNTCPAQGSRTIRTEEAVLITLAELRNKLR